MKRLLALAVALPAAIVCAAMPPAVGHVGAAAGAERAGLGYNLHVDVPPVLTRGESAVLVLHVRRDGQPADAEPVCLAAVPLFVSVEDALDPTPAGGRDLGAADGTTAAPGCDLGIAGERTAPGTYTFTWEPDTAGRVNLAFTAGSTPLSIPVDVTSTPPNAAALALFLLAIAVILAVAARLRRLCPPRERCAS